MIENISVRELKERISKKDQNLVILDVRENDEYGLGTIPGSRHKPLGALIRDMGMIRSELQGKDIVTFCRSGVRATIAAEFLERAGIKAKNLIDGYIGWEREKYS